MAPSHLYEDFFVPVGGFLDLRYFIIKGGAKKTQSFEKQFSFNQRLLNEFMYKAQKSGKC